MAETKKKNQKKEFYEVRSNLLSSKIHLYASSKDELVGKNIKVDLTRNLRGKNVEMTFKVAKEGEDLIAEPIKMEVVGSFIRRMIRNGIDYVEDSFVVETKDGKARVKPFLITRNKVSRAVRRELRNRTKEQVLSHFKTRPSKELFNELMTNKFQKDLSIKLKKVYPLALCEIRWFELE